MKIRLFPAAIRDLKGIRAHIEADDPAAAEKVAARLAKAVELIAQRPQIGRPSTQRPVREWSVPGLPYLIPYRIIDDTLEILRFWHTSQNKPPQW